MITGCASAGTGAAEQATVDQAAVEQDLYEHENEKIPKAGD
jgi:hypothetical protein